MSSSPAIIRKVVDLPQPEGPTSTTTSPSASILESGEAPLERGASCGGMSGTVPVLRLERGQHRAISGNCLTERRWRGTTHAGVHGHEVLRRDDLGEPNRIELWVPSGRSGERVVERRIAIARQVAANGDDCTRH